MLTQYTWNFYHYGPWTIEAQRDLDGCVASGVLEPVPYTREAGGGEITLYRACSPFITDLSAVLSPTIELALKDEIKRWSRAPLNAFLNYIYFDTPPMRDARRGERLRFEPELFEAPPLEPPRKRHTSRPSREAFARLLARRTESAEQVPVPCDAILDADYLAALNALDAQDEVRGLSGAVEIDPDNLSG